MEKINKLKRNQLKNLAKTKKPLNFQHAVNRLDLKKKITVINEWQKHTQKNEIGGRSVDCGDYRRRPGRPVSMRRPFSSRYASNIQRRLPHRLGGGRNNIFAHRRTSTL